MGFTERIYFEAMFSMKSNQDTKNMKFMKILFFLSLIDSSLNDINVLKLLNPQIIIPIG